MKASKSEVQCLLSKKYININKIKIKRTKKIEESPGSSEATGLHICSTLFCSELSFLPENISYLMYFQGDFINTAAQVAL